MKVTVNEGKVKEHSKYPCLMIVSDPTDGNFGLILFLTGDGTGIVVGSTEDCELGEYSDTWDTDSMDIFTGSVTLSND